MLVAGPVVGQVTARQADLRRDALEGATGGINHAVALVPGPTYATQVTVGFRAEIVHEVDVALRRVGQDPDGGAFERQPVVDRVVFRDRHAETHACSYRRRVVAAHRGQVRRVDLALVDVETAAYAVVGVVRIGIGQRVNLVDAARADLERQRVAGTENIAL